MTTEKPVRIIHVGLGPWGQNWARDVVPFVAGVEAVAWVEPPAEARAAAAVKLGLPPERCFASLDEAARAVDAEAVLGTVAVIAHAPVIEAGLGLGLDVLIEKPLAPSAGEAARLAGQAADAGRILHVSQNYRFYPAVAKTRQIVQERRLGEVITVDIDFHKYDPDHRYKALPDPLLADMLIHQIDLIRFILGEEPVEVVCWTWNPPDSPFSYDPSAAAMIRMASGAVVTLRGSWLSREAPTNWAGDWRIQCTGGRVGFTSRAGGAAGPAGDRVALRPLGGDEEAVPLDPIPLLGRAGTLNAFARAIRGQDTPGWESTAAHNLGSLRLMEAAIRSAANGGAVTPVG